MIYDSDYLRTLKARKRAERRSEYLLFFTVLTAMGLLCSLLLYVYAIQMAPIAISLQPY